jgi:hypothetical protein
MCFTYQFRVSLTSSGFHLPVPVPLGVPPIMGHRFHTLVEVHGSWVLVIGSRLRFVCASFIVCFCFVYRLFLLRL